MNGWDEIELSYEAFWFHCLCSTCSAVLGLSKSSLVRRFLPRNSLAGVKPIELCGVFQYASKILKSLDLIEPSLVFFRPVFTICTAFLTKPLVEGWFV